VKVGDLVYDFALGRVGIIVGEAWVEQPHPLTGTGLSWEWTMLDDDGNLIGADTVDLKVIS